MPKLRGVAGHGHLGLCVAGGIGWSKAMNPIAVLQLSKRVFPYANGAA